MATVAGRVSIIKCVRSCSIAGSLLGDNPNQSKSCSNWMLILVDFPINSMVDLSMAKCKRSPEGNPSEEVDETGSKELIPSGELT